MKKFLILLIGSVQLMSANIDWSFPPNAISTVGQTAENPSIAIDMNGNAIAVWVESGLVKSRLRLAGESWNANIFTLSGSGASSSRVVSDRNGNATVVWVENGFVKSTSKTLNGNWSSVVSLSGHSSSSPTIAVGLSGDVIVAWVKNGDVQSTTKLFGGNWQNAVTIDAKSSALPHIAIAGSGVNARAVLAWQGVASSVNVVYGASKLISSSSWGGKQILSDTRRQAGYARAAVDTNGNATAVWFAYNQSGSNYYGVTVESASRPFDGNWTPYTILSEAGIGNPENLSLRVSCDLSGNTIALWSTTFDNESFSIQSAVRNAYKYWSGPINLVANNLYAYNAHLAVDSLGEALALYMFYNGTGLIIQSAELDITGFMDESWSLPLNLSQGSANARPFIVSCLNENVIHTAAVWLGNSGMYNSVFASIGVKPLVSPPSNLGVTQGYNNFGVFTEYYNTLTWDASEDPTVVGYLIYRNGVFLKQVGSDVLQIIDDNKVQNGPVIYGVAAVDDQQSHSQIVMVNFP